MGGLVNSSAVSASKLNELEKGKHYTVLRQSTKKYENAVIEFFSYSCPYCYRALPAIKVSKSQLSENIDLINIPFISVRASINFQLMHGTLKTNWASVNHITIIFFMSLIPQ